MNKELLFKHISTVEDFPLQGIRFYNVNPIFADHALHSYMLDLLLQEIEETDMDSFVVTAPEARGFLVAPSLALKLKTGFYPIRKAGKLPTTSSLKSITFTTEYSKDTLEIDLEGKSPNGFVVYDDVLATGGTAAASLELLNTNNKVVFLFLLEISFLKGREFLISKGIKNENIISIFQV